MALSTAAASGGPILTPEDVGALVTQPALDQATAALVSTTVTTSAHSYRIPVLTDDPNAAWVDEGEEISPSDAVFAEVDVVPAKIAALTIISRELADDSSPEASATVGQAIARDISRVLDNAFFGSLAAPAPAGLAALAGVTTVDGTATDLDVFAEALSAVETTGAAVSNFVASPATALTLAQLKDETGSNRPLLGMDPTVPTRRVIFGTPLLVSPYVADNTVWAVPQDRVFLVVREDVRLDVSTDAFFTSDRLGVRATMRAAFGFPHPAAVAKVTLTTA